MAARAKLRLRQDVRQAGLGDRLANTWRVDIYPKSASARTHAPAVQISSKAPKLMLAHGTNQIIKSQSGVYLAIPTEHTPRRGRRFATPPEVEAIYNQDLIFVRRGRTILAFVDVARAKGGKTWRRASKQRLAQGRGTQLVLMFVMVEQVHLRSRLNWQRIFAELSQEWPTLFAGEIAEALSAGVN